MRFGSRTTKSAILLGISLLALATQPDAGDAAPLGACGVCGVTCWDVAIGCIQLCQATAGPCVEHCQGESGQWYSKGADCAAEQ